MLTPASNEAFGYSSRLLLFIFLQIIGKIFVPHKNRNLTVRYLASYQAICQNYVARANSGPYSANSTRLDVVIDLVN